MLRNIWEELEDMNRSFEETFGLTPTYRTYPLRRFFGFVPPYPKMVERPFVPVGEIYADKGDLVIKLELPGIDPKTDVTVTVEDHELVIKGVRKRDLALKEKDVYRLEGWYGEFERHYTLPPNIDEKAITVEYKAGILSIVVKDGVAKVEALKAKAKEIPIKVEEKAKEFAKT